MSTMSNIVKLTGLCNEAKQNYLSSKTTTQFKKDIENIKSQLSSLTESAFDPEFIIVHLITIDIDPSRQACSKESKSSIFFSLIKELINQYYISKGNCNGCSIFAGKAAYYGHFPVFQYLLTIEKRVRFMNELVYSWAIRGGMMDIIILAENAGVEIEYPNEIISAALSFDKTYKNDIFIKWLKSIHIDVVGYEKYQDEINGPLVLGLDTEKKTRIWPTPEHMANYSCRAININYIRAPPR